MTETLEARPALYRGASMRSRLEVRWAVWMDALGIPWEYEPAPVLVHGRPRWPDFWLPSLRVWLEVKPAGTPPDAGLAMAVAEATASPLLWVAGSPYPGEYRVSIFQFGGLGVVRDLRFALGRRDHRQLWLCDVGRVLSIPLPPRELRDDDDFPLFDCFRLQEAYRVASGWRFEEGT